MLKFGINKFIHLKSVKYKCQMKENSLNASLILLSHHKFQPLLHEWLWKNYKNWNLLKLAPTGWLPLTVPKIRQGQSTSRDSSFAFVWICSVIGLWQLLIYKDLFVFCHWAAKCLCHALFHIEMYILTDENFHFTNKFTKDNKL